MPRHKKVVYGGYNNKTAIEEIAVELNMDKDRVNRTINAFFSGHGLFHYMKLGFPIVLRDFVAINPTWKRQIQLAQKMEISIHKKQNCLKRGLKKQKLKNGYYYSKNLYKIYENS